MKTGRIVGLFTAILVLLAVSAQAATEVFFTDFDTYRLPNDLTEYDLSIPARPNGTYAIPQIWRNYETAAGVTNIGVWYRGLSDTDNAWGTLQGMTNAAVRINQAPADSLAGAGLKLGLYQGWDRFAVCNIGSTYNVDINYTFTYHVSLYENGRPLVDTANNATGTILVAMGYADLSLGTTNFVTINQELVDLTGTNWMEGSISVNGGSLGGAHPNALGEVAFIKIGKTWDTMNNSTNYQAWADWVKVEANDPWADHVLAASLNSSDRTADDDGDGVDNFTEWATGGDPKDAGDTGFVGYSIVYDQNADGTNEFAYITPRITNHWASGIQYGFERASDLVVADWVEQFTWNPSDYQWDWQPVNSEGFGTGYDAVTNIFVATNGVQFIRGTVDHPSYTP